MTEGEWGIAGRDEADTPAMTGTKRAARVFVFRNLSRKLHPFAFRRASGRNAGIKAISYDIKNRLHDFQVIVKPVN